jgi:hypothetical protein
MGCDVDLNSIGYLLTLPFLPELEAPANVLQMIFQQGAVTPTAPAKDLGNDIRIGIHVDANTSTVAIGQGGLSQNRAGGIAGPNPAVIPGAFVYIGEKKAGESGIAVVYVIDALLNAQLFVKLLIVLAADAARSSGTILPNRSTTDEVVEGKTVGTGHDRPLGLVSLMICHVCSSCFTRCAPNCLETMPSIVL